MPSENTARRCFVGVVVFSSLLQKPECSSETNESPCEKKVKPKAEIAYHKILCTHKNQGKKNFRNRVLEQHFCKAMAYDITNRHFDTEQMVWEPYMFWRRETEL